MGGRDFLLDVVDLLLERLGAGRKRLGNAQPVDCLGIITGLIFQITQVNYEFLENQFAFFLLAFRAVLEFFMPICQTLRARLRSCELS